MENRGQVLVLLLLIGVLFPAIPLSTIPVDANPLTTVILELQEEPVEVDVSPGSSGIAVISGAVTCKKFGPNLVNVHLEAESDCDGASVVPPNFVFSGSTGSEQTDTFSVTTRVPQGTSCSEILTVTVDGNFEQGGMQYDIESESAYITVLQFYMVEVSSEEGFGLNARSGEDVDLEFIIHNAGNGNDVFKVDFLNREVMEDGGFDLPEPLEIKLPENATESLSLNIGIPEDRSGDFLLILSVSSKGSEQSIFDVLVVKEIYLEVKGQSFAEKIGSIFLSPLLIIIIVIIIVVAFVIKWKRG